MATKQELEREAKKTGCLVVTYGRGVYGLYAPDSMIFRSGAYRKEFPVQARTGVSLAQAYQDALYLIEDGFISDEEVA